MSEMIGDALGAVSSMMRRADEREMQEREVRKWAIEQAVRGIFSVKPPTTYNMSALQTTEADSQKAIMSRAAEYVRFVTHGPPEEPMPTTAVPPKPARKAKPKARRRKSADGYEPFSLRHASGDAIPFPPRKRRVKKITDIPFPKGRLSVKTSRYRATKKPGVLRRKP